MPLLTKSAPTFHSLDAQRVRARRKPAATLLAGLLAAIFMPSEADAANTEVQNATVEGGLDKSAVREVVRANIDQVRSCYNAELVDDATIEGSSVLAFVVRSDGSVTKAKVPESTMPPRFDRCMRRAVSTWSFPVAEAQTRVSYPFTMSPG
ncbi:AgmX/PglI C-terminal domain-containing protein [Enhygromyxa salina]|uniref:Gram-negative bacterial tonB protein n=1 Tax=Enhygromyxa salina TaxID=215803 RepID=A0A2S9YSW1_9BACT|nr:AgmX/PglI C-terminal domain-containing protein [Enhygromyxa salina]PRQ08129.1 Gram-negative bacterial tonB protein [Enhygromyxa salina]